MKIRSCVFAPAAVLAALVALASPAGACAGLVTPGGNVRLTRTATLAAFSKGVEHYVTSFRFEGGGAEFGSIVPLPAIPSKVERGGDWTLQRLERETHPQRAFASPAAAGASDSSKEAQVVYETRIDALDITILKGGGSSVGDWARQHGYKLTPDAPAMLDFYAARSKIFMAARFNAQAAKDRNQAVGDGTPIHLTIPTKTPWVPLRILGLGVEADKFIDADVYLLTTRKPALLPVPAEIGAAESRAGMRLQTSGAASKSLLDDLRSDKGMEWMPASMWLTYISIDDPARTLRHDLAIDASGRNQPSYVAAGLRKPAPPATTTSAAPTTTAAPTTVPTTEPSNTGTSIVAAPPVVDSSGWLRASAVADASAVLLLIGAAGMVLVVRRRTVRQP
jgi:hypothetical protein